MPKFGYVLSLILVIGLFVQQIATVPLPQPQQQQQSIAPSDDLQLSAASEVEKDDLQASSSFGHGYYSAPYLGGYYGGYGGYGGYAYSPYYSGYGYGLSYPYYGGYYGGHHGYHGHYF